MNNSNWTKYSWRSFTAAQQPRWPDAGVCDDTLKSLAQLPPLVFAGESLTLKHQLAEAVEGKAFVLQCGDCAEDFSRCTGTDIRDLLQLIDLHLTERLRIHRYYIYVLINFELSESSDTTSKMSTTSPPPSIVDPEKPLIPRNIVGSGLTIISC